MDLENVSQKGWKWHPLLLERYLLKVKRIDSGSKDIMDSPTGGKRKFQCWNTHSGKGCAQIKLIVEKTTAVDFM